MKWEASKLLPAIFIVLAFLGIQISISEYYYYSAPLWIVYFLSVVLVSVVVKSKLYFIPIFKKQYLALVPVFLLLLISWFLVPHFKRFGIYPFGLLCFLYSGLILYNSRLRFLRLTFILSFFICALNLFPLLFYIAEYSSLTRPLINTFFLTNLQESSEYMKGKFSILHVLIIALFLFPSLYLFFPSNRESVKIKMGHLLLISYFLSLSLMLFTSPMNAILSEYRLYRKDRRLMQNMIKERKDGYLNSAVKIKNEAGQANKVMIIIGESLNRNLMSIYGYSQQTTPSLEKLYRDTTAGKVYLFNNIISPEVTTMPSLRKVLTNINNLNKLSFENCVTVVDLFERAGYETVWLSNQRSMGANDTPTAVFAMTSDYHYFTDSRLRISSNNAATGEYYDNVLLPVIKQNMNGPDLTRKRVFFIHLMGSHYYYEDRYPKSFERFKPEVNNDLNRYLNTVYFNDYVVTNIIKIAKENDFDLVCYFSDHGEDITYQHNEEKYNRGMSTIPFLVYISANYARKHPDLIGKMLKNKDTPGMTDNFFHDIQVLSGFSSSLFNPTQSFLNKEYKINKRRVANNRIPYD